VKPVRPKKTIILLTSLLGGILMGFVVSLWFEIRAMGLARLIAAIAPPESVS